MSLSSISSTELSSEGNFTGEGWNCFCDGAAIDRVTRIRESTLGAGVIGGPGDQKKIQTDDLRCLCDVLTRAQTVLAVGGHK